MRDAIELPLDLPEIEARVSNGGLFRRSVLPSGVRLLTEEVVGAASTSIGLWVPVGSRDELSHEYGSTHVLEHLLFKGTPSRTAFEVSAAFERVGGEVNAQTAKEHTLYHAKVRDADLPMAVEVLSDMITSSTIDAAEFEIERGVIIEELAMADDDPNDVVWERFYETLLGTHPLARPIGGTPASIRAAERDAVWSSYRQHYRPEELVVTIAGAVKHDEVREQLERHLRAGGWDLDANAAPVARRQTALQLGSAVPTGPLSAIDRPLEQLALVIGGQGITQLDPRREAFGLMHRIFGGGMSSRLFQEIREKRGLAYSVYSFGGSHSDLGVTGMYAGCAPDNVLETVRVLRQEADKLVQDGVTATELADAKSASAGGSALAIEDADTRMSRLGRAEIHTGRFYDLEAALSRVDAVTLDEVQSVAADMFSGELVASAVGKLSSEARTELERR